jgi:thymidylate synthase
VSYKSIDELLIGLSTTLLRDGQPRATRGLKSYELPGPVIIELENPTARLITLPERHWPTHMGYAESLWIASGRNDLDFMSPYLQKLNDFSDDGIFIRGGYGPRLRAYNNSKEEYRSSEFVGLNDSDETVDQLSYIVDCLTHESTSRRAIIEFGDPNKDNYSNKKLINNNKLDMYVHMRSNDFIWGMTGVNIFNYTFMQEYLSQILDVPLGSYYHITNNLHYYDNYKNKLECIAKSNCSYDCFTYSRDITTYSDFISKLKKLSEWESKIRKLEISTIIDLESDFMNDWQKVIFDKLTGNKSKFVNPLLNREI